MTDESEEPIVCAKCGAEKHKYYCHVCEQWYCGDDCYSGEDGHVHDIQSG